jgi:hypothetical protein
VKLTSLHIAATDETPEVLLTVDGEECSILGKSLPENAFDFYEPVLQWIRLYSEKIEKPLRLNIKFDYFNSSSGRYLFELLHTLEKSKYKENYRVIWITDKDDELMFEKGLELKSLCDIAFDLVSA